jgi:multiple sugar transport system substrate-binding protein
LQQAIATGTVDFDIIEMGAPFEGDTAGKGLLDEMPDWVKDQIEADDLVGYLQPPVGTWDGKSYRITIDGDCHTFSYRKDYFGEGSVTGRANPPKTWQEVNQISKDVAGKEDPLTGLPAHGYLDPLKGWGGFGFYFLENRAAAYAKHPNDPAWLFDPDTMKPRVNNPAWVQAIQDVMDLIATDGAYPTDQINADPGTTGFQQFLAGTGSMLMWWGDIGSNARTSDTSVVGDVVGFGMNPGSDRVYNSISGAWEDTYNEAPNMAYLGWGVYVTKRVSGDEKKRKAAWSAAAHLGGKDISLWMSAYPSGFSLIGTRISNMMNGKLRAMTAPLSRIIWDRTQIATTIQTPPSNRVFRASSNITLLQKMSWQKAMRANTDRRKKPLMRSPQLGKRSPIKSGAIARLSCIKRRLVCNIIVLGRAGIPALPA